MKYAIISDVHGNAHALRLALEDARREGAQGFLFAGDYCISMPWANEAITLIRSTPNAHIIRGNDDVHLHVTDGDDGQYEVSRWCTKAVTPENHAWLDALPDRLDFILEGVPVHMAHSSEAFVGKALHARFRTSLLPSLYPDGPVSRDALTEDFRTFASTSAPTDATAGSASRAHPASSARWQRHASWSFHPQAEGIPPAVLQAIALPARPPSAMLCGSGDPDYPLASCCSPFIRLLCMDDFLQPLPRPAQDLPDTLRREIHGSGYLAIVQTVEVFHFEHRLIPFVHAVHGSDHIGKLILRR